MNAPEDEFHRHLSAAILALPDCLAEAGPARRATLTNVARLLTAAQELAVGRAEPSIVARAAPPDVNNTPDDESDDERIERQADEARRRADQVLRSLGLTAAERRFAGAVGERIVDLAGDAYRDSVLADQGFDPCCIPAAVAAALAIVYRSDECEAD